MKTTRNFMYILIVATLLVGCFPQTSAVTNVDPIYTQAAQTIAVTLTYGAVQSTILAEANKTAEPTATQTLQPSDTPQPCSCSTLTPTQGISTTLTTAMIRALSNTNCREYPSASGEYQSAFLAGQKFALRGRLVDNSWWLIEDPEESAKSCWVWNGTTEVEGDPKLAPVISVPVTPVPSYSISGSVSPATYSGVCPKTVTVYGKIVATAGSDKDLTYGWTTNFGVSPAQGLTEFDEAGTQTVSTTFDITEDTTGYIRFRLYKPVELETERFKMVIDCD